MNYGHDVVEIRCFILISLMKQTFLVTLIGIGTKLLLDRSGR